MLNARIFFITICMLVLGGCSTYVENQASVEFEPIYETNDFTQMVAIPTGGIFEKTKGGLFATDRRARNVGDILTVSLSESFSATKSQSAASAKTDNFGVTLPTQLPNILTGGFTDAGLNGGAARSFSGSGSAAQSNSLSGFLSVTVMRVFDNGNMEIKGQKKLNLNNGDEYVRLTGLVRPQDISASNLVLSNRIADAQITYVGAGETADSARQGWLSKTLRTISPF